MTPRRPGDYETLTEQLGREPLIPFEAIVRCFAGHPLVIRSAPLDPEGHPFPTLYWLTCPEAVKAVARLEAGGAITEFNDRSAADPAFAVSVDAAHAEYAQERARTLPEAEAWGGVGGTRRGVKCLHAHYANHLAGGSDPVGGWVAERVEPVHSGETTAGRVAAIDQGTNSIRLLAAAPVGEDGAELRELARDMVITRLGRGVDASGRLDPQVLARTIRVLERYCRRARALRAGRIHMTATSAVRDATDREELQEAVRRNTGEELEVISGEREAALSFLGATRDLEASRPLLVLDIGGGSTEFAVGDREPEAAVSVQMGSVRLTERHLHTDPPALEEMHAMSEAIRRILDEVETAIPAGRAATLVAVGGTATTVQALAKGLVRYDPRLIHRALLRRADSERVLARLASSTNAERAALPVMAPGRGDVIVAGAAILAAVMSRWGFEEAVVSEEDILDGLAVEMLTSG